MSELSEFVEEHTQPEPPDGRRRPKRKDLIDQTFGYLTPLRFYGNGKGGNARWTCQCACGRTKVVAAHHLISGDTQSCGCIRKGRGGHAPNQDARAKLRRRKQLAPKQRPILLAKLIEISSDDELSRAMDAIAIALLTRKGARIGS